MRPQLGARNYVTWANYPENVIRGPTADLSAKSTSNCEEDAQRISRTWYSLRLQGLLHMYCYVGCSLRHLFPKGTRWDRHWSKATSRSTSQKSGESTDSRDFLLLPRASRRSEVALNQPVLGIRKVLFLTRSSFEISIGPSLPDIFCRFSAQLYTYFDYSMSSWVASN